MFAKDQSVSLPINNTLVHHGTRFHLLETYKLPLSFADSKLLNRYSDFSSRRPNWWEMDHTYISVCVHISRKLKVLKTSNGLRPPNSRKWAWTPGHRDAKGDLWHSWSFQNHSLTTHIWVFTYSQINTKRSISWAKSIIKEGPCDSFLNIGINPSCYKNRCFQQTTALFPQSDSVESMGVLATGKDGPVRFLSGGGAEASLGGHPSAKDAAPHSRGVPSHPLHPAGVIGICKKKETKENE